ncbi:fibulin 1 L homeolog isoform X2 [Xenopus laevis]|uniref:Fibulin-1 n=2 Tax=Xenopus laevis TaxID=8355 RepID=A0A8J1MHI4_XENLA|nr:fibulin 1 L homeolog isoform X2 [Xenopus laevis]
MLLLAFLPLFLGRVTTEPSIDSCCNSGYEWATQKIECTHLPVLSDSKECRLTQEQCCMNQLEDLHCTTGINIANEREECETSENEANSTCEARFIKQRCCHCCLLGRMAQTQGRSCDKNMFLGYQCEQVFRACCVRGQEGLDIPNRDVSKDEANAASIPHSDNEDPYLNDRCRGGGPCNQQCSDTGISVVCSCYAGYQLQPDGFSCEDINECISGSHTCKVGQVCINLVGSFRCQREVNCGTGYELMEDNNCKDIDECATATHNCLPNFNCQNTPGSFRCRPKVQCSSGYIQDALGHCIDINECVSVNAPCPPGQTCINTEGSYTCQRHVVNCGRGYHLSADGTKCEDINECASTQNPCGEGHGCMNVPGSYKCECRIGYNFDPISRTCIDVNECRGYPGRVCAHKCENTAGSFFCSCSTGFKLALDGRSCDDVDECSNNPCSQECANVYGSYQCYCRRGYQLSDVDGITCEDIDECALPTGGHICSYRCNNVPGSFRCSCPSNGYTLAPNGRNCQDVDECVTGSHNCSDTENCFNIQGGFRCLSFDCPKNYRKTGDTRCERLPCIDPECQHLPLRMTYHQLTFPTNIQAPTDIFRMGPSHSLPGDDIQLSITSGNERGYFTTKYVNPHSGLISVQQPIAEPQDILLTIQMTLVRYGTVSTFIAKLHVFVTPEL